ncbi:hypothetical protein [Psychrobacter sp. DAB_AL32B]|uniref:hypothetical protein n=1 Tax=Psychrobacter sp. DAB_AL32B TaxID=1028414 RepID=UPI000B802587|nr:hypothetical protein [Psychrobacter sp. DAB_AL32B]OXL23339.1 hypothetical protein CAN34_07395 [Psychrobacter sp. DAB_AL32B]
MIADGIIEIPGIIILIACILRCAQYVIQSQSKQSHYFWLASVLTFFAVIRRELNYLPELFISSDFSLLNHSYDWWEDAILLVVYLSIIGLLAYTWRYLWALLKSVPVSLYLIVVALATLEYMGENTIIIPESIGQIVEEIAETGVYAVALVYLWRFKTIDFERDLSYKLYAPCKV